MAEVENDQRQLWGKNLTRLVDVFDFVALTSVITTLSLAFIKYNNGLQFIIITALTFLIDLTIFSLGSTFIFYTESMLTVFVQVLPYNTHSLTAMSILSCILLAISLVGSSFLEILFFLKKRFPGNDNLGFIHAEMELRIMEYLIILFINGWASLFGWLILQDIGLRALGFVLVGFLGFVSFVCCIYRLIYRWKEYHRAGAMVSSVDATTTAAV